MKKKKVIIMDVTSNIQTLLIQRYLCVFFYQLFFLKTISILKKLELTPRSLTSRRILHFHSSLFYNIMTSGNNVGKTTFSLIS